MADFYEIDHPCVPYMKVPVYGRPPMRATEMNSAEPSDAMKQMLAYIFRDVPTNPKEGLS